MTENRFYIDYDNNNIPYHIFSIKNPFIEANKLLALTESGEHFWQVRLLPQMPTGKAQIVAQRTTLEEAITVMLEHI